MSDDLEQRLHQLVIERRAHADNRTCFDMIVETVEGSPDEEESDILWKSYPILVREGMIHAARAVEDYFGYRPIISRGTIKNGILSTEEFVPAGIVTPNTFARFVFDQANRHPSRHAIDILEFAAREIDDPACCSRFISLANYLEQKADYLRQSEIEFSSTDYFIATSVSHRIEKKDKLRKNHDNLLWQRELLHQTMQRAAEDMSMEEQYTTAQDALIFRKHARITYEMDFPHRPAYAGAYTLTGDLASLHGESLRLEIAIDAANMMMRNPLIWKALFQNLQQARNNLYSAQDDLAHAVKEEKYEQAAVLRDRIRQLENDLAHFD